MDSGGRREIKVFRELLRNGRSTVRDLPPLPVFLDRFLQRGDIDAVVLVEVVVFGDEDGRRRFGEICEYGTG